MITAELTSGMQVTMHRSLMVLQIEGLGYSSRDAFALICKVEDAFPLAIKVKVHNK